MRSYLLNKEDERPPVQFKKRAGSREHRANKEFTTRTKKEKYRDAKGRCEECRKKLSFKTAHFHHILSLSYAFHYFPNKFPDDFLKSYENCKVLCEECHDTFHRTDSLAVYAAIAHNLLQILETWEKPRFHRKVNRDANKRYRRKKQKEAAENLAAI